MRHHSSAAFTHLIRSCGGSKSISRGKEVHAQLITSGFNPDVYTSNHLITMYLKLKHVDYAGKLFERMPERNLITWTTLISSYSQMGLPEKALNCFRLMVSDEGFAPNDYTYVGALSACSSLLAVRAGKEIHGRIYRSEENVNNFVSNSLVNFYGKCGLLESARIVFDSILDPNTVSWISLISCYSQSGENEEGLRIFTRSLKMGAKTNEFSCGTVFGACAALGYLELGMQVHCLVFKCGVRIDQFLVTSLVNFYANCGEPELAYRAFKEVNKPELPAWTALIGGYVQLGKGKEATDHFSQLLASGLKPSERTISSVLGAFRERKDIYGGRELHSLIIKLGFDAFVFVCNAVMDFYARCDHLEEVCRIFWEMDEHDIVSWNSLIAGCLKSGNYDEAIRFFREMLLAGFCPSLYTYSSILSVCGDLPAIEWGKQTHCCIMKLGLKPNEVVGSALVDMYAKCGQLNVARKVFDILPLKNLVLWNTMLTGYTQHGFGREALEIYDSMLRNGVQPNHITFVAVLSSCAHLGLVEQGLRHFESMTRAYGITVKTDHLACMVSLFARRGQTDRAFELIRNYTGEINKVVWRCLLSGCINSKDFALGKYAAEKILRIDPEDTSAYIMLYNIYADLKMWNEASQIRKLMKEKALKKEIGYSWTELQDHVYLFSAGDNMNLQANAAREVLSELTTQLLDAGYVPDSSV